MTKGGIYPIPFGHARRSASRRIIESVTLRRDLWNLLSVQPRSASSLARELGLRKSDIDEDLRHVIRSARAAGHFIMVEPARCRSCGFTFSEDKLSKPSKCPMCRGTRLYEAQIRIKPGGR